MLPAAWLARVTAGVLLAVASLPLASAEYWISYGLCPVGQCINCMSCDGDCRSNCACFNSINTCCCRCPAGSFARGYQKVPCPGGTWQDVPGSGSCKLCNDTKAVLYNISWRGASSLIDCERALCQCTDSQCEEDSCMSPIAVEERMLTQPPDTQFCAEKLGLDALSCTWRPNAAGQKQGVVGPAFLAFAVTLLHTATCGRP